MLALIDIMSGIDNLQKSLKSIWFATGVQESHLYRLLR